MLSKYTSDMNKVINAYEKTNPSSDQNTVVLFFVDVPNPDKLGFMPLTGQYGFMLKSATNVELLAHELVTRSVKPVFWKARRTEKPWLN